MAPVEALEQPVPTFAPDEDEEPLRDDTPYWKGYKASDLGLTGG